MLLLGADGNPDGMETQVLYVISDGLDGQQFEIRGECGRTLIVRPHEYHGDTTVWIEEDQIA